MWTSSRIIESYSSWNRSTSGDENHIGGTSSSSNATQPPVNDTGGTYFEESRGVAYPHANDTASISGNPDPNVAGDTMAAGSDAVTQSPTSPMTSPPSTSSSSHLPRLWWLCVVMPLVAGLVVLAVYLGLRYFRSKNQRRHHKRENQQWVQRMREEWLASRAQHARLVAQYWEQRGGGGDASPATTDVDENGFPIVTMATIWRVPEEMPEGWRTEQVSVGRAIDTARTTNVPLSDGAASPGDGSIFPMVNPVEWEDVAVLPPPSHMVRQDMERDGEHISQSTYTSVPAAVVGQLRRHHRYHPELESITGSFVFYQIQEEGITFEENIGGMSASRLYGTALYAPFDDTGRQEKQQTYYVSVRREEDTHACHSDPPPLHGTVMSNPHGHVPCPPHAGPSSRQSARCTGEYGFGESTLSGSLTAVEWQHSFNSGSPSPLPSRPHPQQLQVATTKRATHTNTHTHTNTNTAVPAVSALHEPHLVSSEPRGSTGTGAGGTSYGRDIPPSISKSPSRLALVSASMSLSSLPLIPPPLLDSEKEHVPRAAEGIVELDLIPPAEHPPPLQKRKKNNTVLEILDLRPMTSSSTAPDDEPRETRLNARDEEHHRMSRKRAMRTTTVGAAATSMEKNKEEEDVSSTPQAGTITTTTTNNNDNSNCTMRDMRDMQKPSSPPPPPRTLSPSGDVKVNRTRDEHPSPSIRSRSLSTPREPSPLATARPQHPSSRGADNGQGDVPGGCGGNTGYEEEEQEQEQEEEEEEEQKQEQEQEQEEEEEEGVKKGGEKREEEPYPVTEDVQKTDVHDRIHQRWNTAFSGQCGSSPPSPPPLSPPLPVMNDEIQDDHGNNGNNGHPLPETHLPLRRRRERSEEPATRRRPNRRSPPPGLEVGEKEKCEVKIRDMDTAVCVTGESEKEDVSPSNHTEEEEEERERPCRNNGTSGDSAEQNMGAPALEPPPACLDNVALFSNATEPVNTQAAIWRAPQGRSGDSAGEEESQCSLSSVLRSSAFPIAEEKDDTIPHPHVAMQNSNPFCV